MGEINYSKKWVLLPFLMACVLLYSYFGNYLFTANEWIYSLWGDAFKNYYHVVFGAKNADGLWLNQVNYPFGENLLFLDAQVLIVKFLKWFHLEKYTIAIVNLLPLFSIAIAVIPLFLIQRLLKIPLWINSIGALLIAFLSPQIVRATGHFGLSYVFFIPMLLYGLMTIQKQTVLNYIFIALLIFCFSYLHPYYLILGVAMVLAFLPYHLLVRFSKKAILMNVLTIVFTLFFFKLTLFLTDPIVDRPNPTGINMYRATFNGVFYPKFGIFKEWLPHTHLSFEANAYVGILGFPAFLLLLWWFFNQIILKNKKETPYGNHQLKYLLYASLFIWFVALYYPLKALIDPVLELFPPLKQFRSLGRFAWILYYVFSIFIVVQIAYWYRRTSNKIIAVPITIFLLALWAYDAHCNIVEIQKQAQQSVALNTQESYAKDFPINETFDFIVALPIVHVGAEIANFYGSGLAWKDALLLSDKLNTPIFSTNSSRVSKQQFLAVKKMKETGSFKHIIKQNAKVLIIADPVQTKAEDSLLLNKAIFLFHRQDLDFYSYDFKVE